MSCDLFYAALAIRSVIQFPEDTRMNERGLVTGAGKSVLPLHTEAKHRQRENNNHKGENTSVQERTAH